MSVLIDLRRMSGLLEPSPKTGVSKVHSQVGPTVKLKSEHFGIRLLGRLGRPED